MLTASSWVCSCPKTDLMAEVAEAIFCLSFIRNTVQINENKVDLENGHQIYIETCSNSCNSAKYQISITGVASSSKQQQSGEGRRE